MPENIPQTDKRFQFFVRYDLNNWLASGHSADEWDAYQAFFAKMRRDYGDLLYVIDFDFAKYQEWLGGRENTGARQREWAEIIAQTPKPRSLESLIVVFLCQKIDKITNRAEKIAIINAQELGGMPLGWRRAVRMD
jgi:hypothetical protein